MRERWIFEPDFPDRVRLECIFFKRMGYRDTTVVPPQIIKHARSALNISIELAKPKAIVQLSEVLAITENTIHGEGISIESQLWAGLASRAVLPLRLAVFAMTLGKALSDEAVNTKKSSLSKAYFIHEAGSQIIEQAANQLEEMIQAIPSVQSLIRSRRFSPGYCDISLSNQKSFFHLLSPEEIGIRMSASYGMTPEKSITAALLFSEKLPSSSPCRDCQNDVCTNRREKRQWTTCGSPSRISSQFC